MKEIRLPRNEDTLKLKGYAYVEFESADELPRALGLNKTQLEGRVLSVERARTEDQIKKQNDHTLQVVNLDYSVKEGELLDYLTQKYGEKSIKKVAIITDHNTGKSKGYGFVTFRDKKSLSNCLGAKDLAIKDRKIYFKQKGEAKKRDTKADDKKSAKSLKMALFGR